ncbi:TRAP transporter small permease [Aquibium microcysteis]|uniref:TRAP transporter small permease n=1 Tax=Aquibium microcysteis TaxID=675281 RepID=UPI001EF3012B|nr:TRAP transporter small permease [Aquibium microcysteis]
MAVSRFIHGLARLMAILGGIVLGLITIMTVISITGRAIVTIAFIFPGSVFHYLPFFDGIQLWLQWLVAQEWNAFGATFKVGAVPGDFELVEAGTAFAVFAFLPWCQLNRGHATVDLFTSYLPASANRWIDLLAETLMTIVFIVLAWRLWVGMMDKIRYGETTFILQYPVWWGFASAMVGAVVCVIVSFYMTGVRVREVATGRSSFAPTHGGMH